jgi:PAS domain S-box-containing protein
MQEDYKRALQASESRFYNLIEKTADGVIVLFDDGRISYINPAAEALLRRRGDELVGELFGQPLVPGETAEVDLCPRQNAALDGVAGPQPVPTSRVAEMRVVEIEWEGRPAFLATLRDISERKQMEQELLRRAEQLQEADRRKDNFLAMLAHELRNPLAPILNAAQLMRLQGMPTPDLERARATIERQGQHLARLLDDLLDLSRITHGKITLRKETVDLAATVVEAVQVSRTLMDGRRHQLTVALDDKPLPITGDPTRLSQIVVNLLNNAAKYTDPGGRIALSLGREGAEAVLRIKDTGVGIPSAQLANIFEPFAQVDTSLERSQGGLGLGLALVRNLVHLHGGTIAAHSDGLGKGSEFVVRWPLISPRSSSSSPHPRQTFEQRRILLIEDNLDGLSMLTDLLRLWGHQVETASDGLEGLTAIRRQPPDIALVDIGLPGLNGYELARRVRVSPEGYNVRLVAVTGYGNPEDRRRVLDAGFDAHLVKPVDLKRLEEILADPPRRAES